MTQPFQQEVDSPITPTPVDQRRQHVQEESDSSSEDSDTPRYEYDSFSDFPPLKTRRLSDIYNATQQVLENNVRFVFLLLMNEIVMNKLLNIKNGEML